MKKIFYRKRNVYRGHCGWEDPTEYEWYYSDMTTNSGKQVTLNDVLVYELGYKGNKDELEVEILFEKEL